METWYKWVLQSLKTYRHRPFWKSAFWATAILTTFLTTYFLILPAITLEGNNANQTTTSTSLSPPSDSQEQETQEATTTETSQTSVTDGSETSSVATTSSTESTTSEPKVEPVPSQSYLEGEVTVETPTYTVKVQAQQDAKLPLATRLDVTEIRKEMAEYEAYRHQALDKIDKTIDDIKDVVLYDIKLYDDEQEIQPQAPVTVQVSYKEPLDIKSDELDIVHFKDTGELEVLETKSTEETKQLASDVAFETTSFSVYAIVQNATPLPRITYRFENTDGTPFTFKTASNADASQQVLKNGESLKDVGIPVIAVNKHFEGWYYYDKASNTYGEQVVFNQPIRVTATQERIIRPKYSSIAYVTFYDDAAGTVILQREQLALTNGRGTYDLTTVKAQPPTATQTFAGWSKTKNGAIISETEAKNATITGDTLFYPIFKEAKKVEFITGDIDTGATYIAPRYVYDGETTPQPPNPTRPGYTFGGWVTSQNGNTRFNFRTTRITADTKVYAKWIPAKANVTVIIWNQSATDKPDTTLKTYDYAGQKNRTETVGTTVNLQSSDYTVPTGFEFNSSKSDKNVVVKPDGSSVINVYLDRNVITMKFYQRGDPGRDSWVWDERHGQITVYKGLYETPLTAGWPSTRNRTIWSYYTNYGTSGMSYLGEFKLPTDVAHNNEIRFFWGNNKNSDVTFYKENINGGYVDAAQDKGSAGGGTFYFSEKYTGFEAYSYKVTQKNKTTVTNWTEIAPAGSPRKESVLLNEPSGYFNVPPKQYYNLEVRYRRLSYNFKYLDPLNEDPLENFPSRSVKYEAPLTSYRPDTSEVQPVPSRLGYRWNGKWYKDAAMTQEFDWSTTMPAQDAKVYAGWEKITHRVIIEPEGGQVERTLLKIPYGEKVPDTYSAATRDYVVDPDGTYYYRNDTVSGTIPQNGIYKSIYTTNANDINTDKTQKYSYEKDAYKLIAWYQINPDGTKKLYDFNTAVTSDITLRAEWRRVGEFHVTYSNQAVDQNGQPLIAPGGSRVMTSNEPVDRQRYDDQSNFTLLSRPTIPEGYTFRGWHYNGKLYSPYDAATVLSHLADRNKTVTVYPVLIPIEKLPTKDTFLIYDGNGGSRQENGKILTSVKHTKLELNKTYQAESATYFTRVGYDLIGWHTSKDQASEGIVQFKPRQDIGLDNQPDTSNTLYAVWKPKTYTVRVTKNVKGTDKDKQVLFTFFPNEALDVTTFKLSHGQTKTYTIPYDSEITIGEQELEDFDVTVTVTHKNRPSGKADETVNHQDASPLTVTVDGNIDIVFTNTRKRQLISLQKVSVENLNQPLAGAVFDVYAVDSAGDRILPAKYTGVTSGSDGLLTFADGQQVMLPTGDYRIAEVKAPDGYNLATDDLRLSVTDSGASLLQDGNTAPSQVIEEPDGKLNYRFKITNSRGTELPSTGGIGQTVVSLAGVILITLATLTLYLKNRIERQY
ncbi:InlB B-repeat-containing protein [Streptococcus entericus]|uniref:InlB B-repeat-containing protein n=1 Tax=Streptococcus entericus TaxID=155680 RepID=UPI000373B736|nr:InlB B-repeat-containing protein [Streptococcus entericus]